jgi:hypothetical protein
VSDTDTGVELDTDLPTLAQVEADPLDEAYGSSQDFDGGIPSAADLYSGNVPSAADDYGRNHDIAWNGASNPDSDGE